MGQEYSLEKLIQHREYEVAATWQQRGSNVAGRSSKTDQGTCGKLVLNDT